MTFKEKLQDPLKSLDQIYAPDERQKRFLGTLGDLHKALSDIVLNDDVPNEVSQLFETAKNISLYSWFVYRFHQVAELISYSALEMALRERYLSENPNDADKEKRPPTLYRLMQHAKDSQWITNEGFPSLYDRARHHAEIKKVMKKMASHDFSSEQTMAIDDPDEDEIVAALEDLDLVGAISGNAHKLRNQLAHGSSTLHPNSVSTLRTHAELINQVYPPLI